MNTIMAIVVTALLMSTTGFCADFPVNLPRGTGYEQDYAKMDEVQRRAYEAGLSGYFPAYVPAGFSTGQDYLKMDEAQRRTYAMGAFNGITLASLFGAPMEKMQWFESYTKGMTDIQIAAIIYKYIQDHPGRWHDGLNILTYSAIYDAYRESRSSE